jgi:hypothetical protein
MLQQYLKLGTNCSRPEPIPINYSLIILPCDSTCSELYAPSINNISTWFLWYVCCISDVVRFLRRPCGTKFRDLSSSWRQFCRVPRQEKVWPCHTTRTLSIEIRFGWLLHEVRFGHWTPLMRGFVPHGIGVEDEGFARRPSTRIFLISHTGAPCVTLRNRFVF